MNRGAWHRAIVPTAALATIAGCSQILGLHDHTLDDALDGSIATEGNADSERPDAMSPLDSNVVDAVDANDATISIDGSFDAPSIDAPLDASDAIDAGKDAAFVAPDGETLIAVGDSMPYGLAVDDTNVYWTEASGTILAHAKDGSGANMIIATNQESPFDIFVDSTSVYWSVSPPINPDGGTTCAIARASRDGGISQCLGTALATEALPFRYRTALCEGTFYFTGLTSANTADFTAVTKQGVTSHVFSSATHLSGGNVVAASADNVFFITSTVINDYFPANTTSAPVSGTTGVVALDMAATESNVYWLSNLNNLHVSALTAGDGGVTLAANLGQAERFAIDSNYAYVTDSHGQIYAVALAADAGMPLVLATNQASPVAIAIDATHVYWANTYDFTIVSIAKP